MIKISVETRNAIFLKYFDQFLCFIKINTVHFYNVKIIYLLLIIEIIFYNNYIYYYININLRILRENVILIIHNTSDLKQQTTAFCFIFDKLKITLKKNRCK